MVVKPSSRRSVASENPVTSPGAHASHGTQLDLRLNSITDPSLGGQAKASVNELDGQAKAIGKLIAEALRYSGLSQKEASFRMGYADASKLATWVSGEGVSQFLARFLALPELQRGFLVALAEFARVRVRTVVEIDHERAAS